MSDYVESLFIEIDKNCINYNKNVVIGVIYRPPESNIDNFLQYFNGVLDSLNRENKCVYLMGDYNLNLLNTQRHKLTADFVETVFSYSYIPLINKPTRVTDNSATLIDNILCNDIQNNEMTNGLLYVDISDHFPIFCVNATKQISKDPIYIETRQYNDLNINNFKDKLSLIDWQSITVNKTCQESFSLFHSKYVSCFEECFPLIKHKVTYRNRKPWLTLGLKKSIKIKNKLYVLSLKKQTTYNKNRYTEYKRFLQRLLRNAEREHYDKLFKQNIGNTKKSWEIIKEVINKKRDSKQNSKFKVNGNVTQNEKDIAEGFNSYFVNVGYNLCKSIPICNRSFSDFMPNDNPNSIFLRPADGNEIENIIRSLKKKSPGWDGINALIVKESYSIFSDAFTEIINKSLYEGIFPDELKIAKVTPLYKSEDEMLFSNYRPVSVLPVFSKVFERILYNRLLDFINKHKLLYKYQFGFRPGYGTDLALTILLDKISGALDTGNFVLGVFLDFSKAFDTVNHSILLKKLQTYGIRGVAYRWLESYLSNRHQYVCYNGICSSKCSVKCGVPQGSVLGPLLYLIYVNDIVNVSPDLLPILFADDTNIFLSGNSVNTLVNTMNTELQKLVEWVRVNKLSLNIAKTHYMIFTTKGKNITVNNNVCINNVSLEKVESTKFLGVVIDSKLNWNEHLKYIKGKISRGIGILCKARKLLNITTLVTLYNCFLYPYITYGIEVWGAASDCHIEPLFILQKRAVRIIKSAHYREHTQPLFKELRILRLPEVYEFSVAKAMYKYMKGITPSVMDGMFSINRNIHSHMTRQRNQLHVPVSRTTLRKRTFRHRGVEIWNLISEKIDTQCGFSSFKRQLKLYLINK